MKNAQEIYKLGTQILRLISEDETVSETTADYLFDFLDEAWLSMTQEEIDALKSESEENSTKLTSHILKKAHYAIQ